MNMPVWPDYDTIVRSMNCRANPRASPYDDPLFGIVVTDAMMERAQRASRP
jgi:hypothetical protein